jgi:hypothetical protein
MKIRPFYLLFYIFLIVYFLGYSPIRIFPAMIYYRFPFLDVILQAYIFTFGIFLLIKNYEQFKSYLSNTRSLLVQVFLEKDNKIRTDLFKFVALSLLITFFIDVALTKIADQPIISPLIDLIPGSNVIQKYVPAAYNTTNILNGTANFADFFTFGAVKSTIPLLPGLPIGTLVLFILRQLRYKSKNDKTNHYPGGTILLLFLGAVAIALSFDVIMMVQGRVPLLYPDQQSFTSQYATVYGLIQFTDFSLSFLVNPVFYVATISAWFFDWYLFSRIWIQPQNK